MVTLFLPNYHNYKKNVNENENSSHCFPDDLITLTAFSICEENQGGKVKLKPTSMYWQKGITSAV